MNHRRHTNGRNRAVTPVPSKGVNTMSASLSTKKGKTRGKNPRDIEYQAFDLEKPETLPKSLAEFMEVTGVKDEKEVLTYLVDGFNDNQYSAASDEIGEYVEDAWSKEYQAQFRLAIRNFSKFTGKSIEETVALLKPPMVEAWQAKQNQPVPTA